MKKFTSCFLILILSVFTINFTYVKAENVIGKAVFTVEAFTIGKGYIIEPVEVEIFEGENAARCLTRVIEAAGFELEYWGAFDDGFFLSRITGSDANPINLENPCPPEYLLDAMAEETNFYYDEYSCTDNSLGGGDYAAWSGWMNSVNNVIPESGLSTCFLKDGDVVRVQFSLAIGYDIGSGWDYDYYPVANKDELTRLIARISDENKSDNIELYKNIMEKILPELNIDQSLVDEAYNALLAAVSPESITNEELEAYIEGIINWKKGDKDKLFNESFLTGAGTTSSDWYAMCTGRYGIEEDYSTYLTALEDYITAKYKTANLLDRNKATEWHRIALTVLALGGDPTCIGQNSDGNPVNLIADGIYNRTNPGQQGINGWIWGLISLNSLNFEVPDEVLHDRNKFVSEILGRELSNGGFALSGTKPDPDMTFMAILALSKDYYTNEAIKAVVDRALDEISKVQLSDGDFGTWGTPNAESTAWGITALTSLGIDCEKDERFIKNNKTLIDGILKYYNSNDGGFLHLSTAASSNSMAGEQVLYSLISYLKFRNNQRTFFDMRPEVKNIGTTDININQPWCGKSLAIFEIDSPVETELEFAAALYEDNKLKGITFNKLPLTPDKKTYTLNFSELNSFSGDNMKLFIWQSAQSLIPMSEIIGGV